MENKFWVGDDENQSKEWEIESTKGVLDEQRRFDSDRKAHGIMKTVSIDVSNEVNPEADSDAPMDHDHGSTQKFEHV
jgi:hypothetical protein